jgi:hypothetical protein
LLYCLASDSQAGDLTFEDFCDEFGYDSDSRSAERIHTACQEAGRKLRRALGAQASAIIDRIGQLEH